MDRETPQLSNMMCVSNAYSCNDFKVGEGFGVKEPWPCPNPLAALEAEIGRISARNEREINFKPEKLMARARLVKVYIADTNTNIPIEKSLLYRGDEVFTDLSDQDLFYDIDIKNILAQHNSYRTTVVNEAKSSATEKVFLKPAKVSELSMVITVLASF